MQTTNKLVPISCNSISDQSSAKYGAKLHLQLKVPTGTKVTRNIGLVWFTLHYATRESFMYEVVNEVNLQNFFRNMCNFLRRI